MLANKLDLWGYSSAGRALEWHSRGQRFDPAYLHQKHRMYGVFFDMRDFAILLRRSVAARTATRWRFALRVNSHASLLRKRLRGTLPTPRLSPPIGTHPHRWRFDWLGWVFFYNLSVPTSFSFYWGYTWHLQSFFDGLSSFTKSWKTIKQNKNKKRAQTSPHFLLK